jgi:hypothetical protein
MEDVKIKLSALWVALMLAYQQGDIMRLYSGDFMPGGTIDGFPITQIMWLGMNIMMSIPIIMVYLSITLNYKANRRANLIFAIFFFGFNLIGLPTYPSLYDQFLIILGLGFNVLTVWHAWKWNEDD